MSTDEYPTCDLLELDLVPEQLVPAGAAALLHRNRDDLWPEFARLDLEKYEKGDYPLELRALQIDTALAEEALERAKVQQQFSEDLARDGYINQGELAADRSRAMKVQLAFG